MAVCKARIQQYAHADTSDPPPCTIPSVLLNAAFPRLRYCTCLTCASASRPSQDFWNKHIQGCEATDDERMAIPVIRPRESWMNRSCRLEHHVFSAGRLVATRGGMLLDPLTSETPAAKGQAVKYVDANILRGKTMAQAKVSTSWFSGLCRPPRP